MDPVKTKVGVPKTHKTMAHKAGTTGAAHHVTNRSGTGNPEQPTGHAAGPHIPKRGGAKKSTKRYG